MDTVFSAEQRIPPATIPQEQRFLITKTRKQESTKAEVGTPWG
jgi:hypothetical protein